MKKELLLVSANTIRTPDYIVNSAEEFIKNGWEVTLWSYFQVPSQVSSTAIRLTGPQHPASRLRKIEYGINQSKVIDTIFKLINLALKVPQVVWRKISIRIRRDVVWFHINMNRPMRNHQFDAIAAVDSFAIFPVWKLAKIHKDSECRSNLTNIASLSK